MKKTSDLRVISGKFRGHTLKTPESATTHPMGAREKLALFNMVNTEDAKVLDTYAGSGALGIEALSRGASEVVFIESNHKIARLIQENLQNLGMEGHVLAEKTQQFCKNLQYQNYFNVIFADPPYDRFKIEELQDLGNLLSQNGVLALSSPKELGEIVLPHLRISSAHTYARARITIYRKN